jgi:hypothetical protein
MAGLPWFELDTDYHDSPKVEALKSRLRNPEADAFPSRLYAYCYRHAQDRFDPEVAPHTIEAAAKWRGRRGFLFDALFAVGILEREAGKVVVHGVSERLAPHLAKREADRTRIAEKRDKAAAALRRNGDVAQVSQRHRGDVAGNRDRDKDTSSPTETQEAPSEGVRGLLEADSPIASSLPCSGSARSYGVTLAQVASWQVAYPGVDVLAEVEKARVWLEANPTRRKTHGGMARFLVSWLSRAQDNPRPAARRTDNGRPDLSQTTNWAAPDFGK